MMNPTVPYPAGLPDRAAPRGDKARHFETVYRKYYRRVYLVCMRYSPKSDDAEDLAHDVFVRYFLNFERFRHESCPSTWMYRVAVNLGIQRWRKERIRFLDDQEMESIPDGNHDTENSLLDKITVAKILARFPERTRKILSMFHVERMTQVEISQRLGISRATVIRHLFHLKRSRLGPAHPQPGPLAGT